MIILANEKYPTIIKSDTFRVPQYMNFAVLEKVKVELK
jgi:hypothetical protein